MHQGRAQALKGGSPTAPILPALLLGAAVGVVLARRRRARRDFFRGKSVIITGGSRGLGLVLARQLARAGARLTLLARDPRELERAAAELIRLGTDVLALTCDLRSQAQVQQAIARAAEHYGSIEVLINNAGVIQVGPLDHMRVEDFEGAMAIHLYAPLYATLAVLPYLRRAGAGRIVNIASVGGKIAVPHLLPYSVSKFALVGLSDGLRAELRRERIRVTTVCPGLMRTGSPRHALFKGQHRREYAWFIISDSLPLLSVSAETAARQILDACRKGSARLIIGVHTKGAVLLNELFPGVMTTFLDVANRLLPGASPTEGQELHAGHESESAWAPEWLTRLTRQAAVANNEV